jgi:flagellin
MDELGNEIDRIANNTDYNGIKPLATDSNKGNTSTVNNDSPLNMTMQIGPTKGEVLDLKGQDMTLKGIFNDLDKVSSSGVSVGTTGLTGDTGDNGPKAELKKLIDAKKVDNNQAGKDLTNAVRDAMNRVNMKGAASVSVTVTPSGSVNSN